jgi:hypothetical protein
MVGDQRNKGRNKKFLQSTENENTTYQNLWNTAKAILRGKFITINAYINKTETPQINNVMMHLKVLQKQDQAKLKTSRWREIMKIKANTMRLRPKSYAKNQ